MTETSVLYENIITCYSHHPDEIDVFQGLITCMCPTLGTKLIKFVSCFAFSGRQFGFPGLEDD